MDLNNVMFAYVFVEGLNYFNLVAMPSRPCRYNHIDYALHSWIVHSIFNKDFAYVDTSERFGWSRAELEFMKKMIS